MTEQPNGLPLYGMDDVIAELFEAAGSVAEQLAWDAEARQRLEPWFDGYQQRYRLRAETLRAQGWKVVMAPFGAKDDEQEDRIAAALATRATCFIGFALKPNDPPGQVWRSHAISGLALNNFQYAMMDWDSLLTAPGWPFMAFADGVGNHAALAGPEPLLRAAFPDPAEPWADFETDRAAEERMGRPRWLLDLVAHYAPFALRA